MLTAPAVIVNAAEVAPCPTVTLEGTAAAPGLELESDTAMPPDPAGIVRVTVPELDWPLTIVLGLTVSALSTAAGGFTVKPNVELTPE